MARSDSPLNQEPKSFLRSLREMSQALIGALLIAGLIRSFIFEPFKIPSGSMIPTLLIGDHVFVERYAYGLRIPFTKTWLAEFSDPKRGDVIVFNYPKNEKEDYIKRVVGVPGDVVAMKDGELYVNDEKVAQSSFTTDGAEPGNSCNTRPVGGVVTPEFLPFPYYNDHLAFDTKLETFASGSRHIVQNYKDSAFSRAFNFEVTVPPRSFFAMGDNRDDSRDSRYWGFVPRENLKGRAVRIWLSLNSEGPRCPGDWLYDWIGPVIDDAGTAVGLPPLIDREHFPSVRWDRFGRKII